MRVVGVKQGIRACAIVAALTIGIVPAIPAQADVLPEVLLTAVASADLVIPEPCVADIAADSVDDDATASSDISPSASASPSPNASSSASSSASGSATSTTVDHDAASDPAVEPTGDATTESRGGNVDPAPTSEAEGALFAEPVADDQASDDQASDDPSTPASPTPSPDEEITPSPVASVTATHSPSPSASATAAATASLDADEPTAEPADEPRCPLPPADITAEPGMNAVTLRWTAADDGPTPTAFYVEVVPTDAAQAQVIGRAAVRAATPANAPLDGVVITGLRNGVEYAFTVVAVTADGASAPAAVVTGTPTTGMEGEVAGLLVRFEQDAADALGDSGAAVPGAQAVTSVGLQLGEEVAPDVTLVALSEAVSTAQAESIAAALAQDPAVTWVEPDAFVFTAAARTENPTPSVTVGGDESYAESSWQLWGAYGTGAAPSGGNATFTPSVPGPYAGSGQKVAVIDTGITAHPALAGVVVDGYDFVSDAAALAAAREPDGAVVPFDADGQPGWDADPTDPGDWRTLSPQRDSTWHGTAVAGVIAAQPGNDGGIAGTAPGARIQPVRALSWRGGLLSDIAAAITWASGGEVAGAPANTGPSGIVNLSLALESACTRTLQAAIDGAVERGAVVVAAAGNAADDAARWAPGNCANVITVGATGRDGHRAPYSNWGSTVDVSAPGGSLASDGGILTTSNDGTREASMPAYRPVEGTSIAAAQVSAAAALVRAGDPSLTPQQVYERLTGKVRGFADGTFDATDSSRTGGSGIVDLRLAQVMAACSVSVQTPSGSTDDRYVRFTSSCEYTMPTGVGTVRALIVAGGGGGGAGNPSGAGGGGGGGMREQYGVSVTPGSIYPITVGSGGGGGSAGGYNSGSSGGSSSAVGYSASGGGGGGAGGSGTNGKDGGYGGSGGGAGYRDRSGGAGSTGYSGGSTGAGSPYCGAGGGGAGGTGGTWSSGASRAGGGGSGANSMITGVTQTLAGGGGGGCETGVFGASGSGGGGYGAQGAAKDGYPADSAKAGTANTGGGGGGGAKSYSGQAGGSGVVVLRWSRFPEAPTALTVLARQNAATVSWTAPVHTGAQSLTGYDVELATSPSGPWANIPNSTFGTCADALLSTATSCTLENLAEGSTVYLRVAAVNATGSSPYGSTASAEIFGPVTQFFIATSAASRASSATQIDASTRTAGTAFNTYVYAADSGGRTNTEWTGTVELTSTAFDGTVNAPVTAGGRSSAVSITPTIAGTGRTVTMESAGLTSTSLTFNVNPAVASTATSTATPAASSIQVTVGTSSTTVVSIQLKDAYGNDLTSNPGTLTVSTNGGLLGSLSYVSNGLFTVTLTASTDVRTATITPKISNVAFANPATVQFTPGPESKLVLTRSSIGTASGTVFSTQPKVSVTDANGNVVTTATGTVTASISSGLNGALIGTTTASIAQGVAEFTDLGLTGISGTTYKIRYSAGALISVEQSIQTTVGSATQLVIDQQGAGAVFNTAFTTQPKVRVSDPGGNTVTSPAVTITATVTDDDANVVATKTATTSSGIATFSGMLINADAATYTITYSSGVLTTASQEIVVAKRTQTMTFGALGNKVYGDPQFTISATATSGLPVSYASQTPSICQTGGTNGAEVTIKGAGTCTIRVSQSGNGGYAAAPSVPDQSFTIARAAQSALTMSSAATATYGKPLTLAATGGSGTGAVTFALVSGPCQLTGNTLTPTAASSTCVVKATKLADDNYNEVSSADQSIATVKASQSIVVTPAVPPTIAVNDTYTPVGIATSGGTVVFSIDPATTGVCELTGNGNEVKLTAVGTCTVLADQAGDANHLPATTVRRSLSVGLRNQQIDFPQPNAMVVRSANQAMDAVADSNLEISYSLGAGTSPSNACAVTSSGVVSALAVGTCEIVADQTGNSTWAAASPQLRSFLITPAVPTQPKINSVSAGDGKLTVSYTAPGFDGGIAVTAYRLSATPVGGGPAITTSACPASAPLTCTVSGLQNGTFYSLKLAAVNAQGDSPWASAPDTYRPAAAAYAPGTLVAIPGDAVLDVSWTAPVSLGGGTFVRYELYLTPAGTAYNPSPTTTIANVGTLAHQFTGLVNGTSYDVKIVAITSTNNQEIQGNTTEVRQYPSTVPGPPASVSILVLTPTTIQVTWDDPASNGGAPITGYAVSVVASQGASAVTCDPVAGKDRECEISGMTNSATYTVSVAAQNRMGLGTSNSTTYIVPSSDALLGALVVQWADGTDEALHPVFAAGTSVYTLTVPHAVTSVKVAPTMRQHRATGVKVNGTDVASGQLSAPIPLQVGDNTITVLGTAPDPAFTATYTLTVVRQQPADLAASTVTASTPSITANGTSTTTITVALKDSAGTAIVRSGGVVTLATTRGTIGAVTDHDDGTYTAVLTSSQSAGPAVVTAALGSQALTDDASIVFTAGVADVTTSTTVPSSVSITANGSATTSVVVTLKDQFGNPLTGSGGTVTMSTNRGTVSAVTDNQDGTYAATLTAPTTVGQATVTAKLGGVPLASHATVAFVPGPPSLTRSTLVAAAATLTADGTDSTTVTVALIDAHGNALDDGGSNVEILATAGTIQGFTDHDDGTYTATLKASTVAGSVTVSAKVGGQLLAASDVVEFAPGAAVASTSVITALPTTAVADGQSIVVVTAQARDAHGNNLRIGGATVTIPVPTGLTAATGVVDKGDGRYVREFAAPLVIQTVTFGGTLNGAAIGTSATVNFTADVPSVSTSTVTSTALSITANGTSTAPVTVTLKDAHSHVVVDPTRVVTATTSRGSISGPVDNGDGTYTATLTSGTVAGDATVTAYVDGVAIASTLTVSFVAGPASAARSAITLGTSTLAADGASTTTVTVTLKDANGNLLTGPGGAVAVDAVHGSVGLVVSNGDGTYSATYTSATTTGSDTISARINGSTLTDTKTITLHPGAASPATSTISAADASLVADGDATTVVTVVLHDAFGNALTSSGGVVAISASSGAVGPVIDNGDGTYRATYTSATTAGSDTISATLDAVPIMATASIVLTPVPVPEPEIAQASVPSEQLPTSWWIPFPYPPLPDAVAVWQDDVAVPFIVRLSSDRSQLAVHGAGYRVELSGMARDGSPLGFGTDGTLVAQRGSTVDVAGVSFAPRASLTIEVRARPGLARRLSTERIPLVTTTAFADGSFGARIALPEELTAGEYVIRVSGEGRDERLHVIEIGMRLLEERPTARMATRRVPVVRMQPELKPGGRSTLRALADSIPSSAAGVRIEVTARWGEWDPFADRAKARATQVVRYLRERGIDATYRLVLEETTRAQRQLLGSVTLVASYVVAGPLPPRTSIEPLLITAKIPPVRPLDAAAAQRAARPGRRRLRRPR